METYTPDQREEDWDAYEDEPKTETALPRRARRQFFNRRTAALGALITCAIGFYAGIRVEKSQLSDASSSVASGGGGRAAGLAALLGRGGAARTAGATGSGAAGGATGARGASGAGAGGFAGAGAFAGTGGAGAGGAGAAFGTVASVNGKTILVTDISGNTVKVKLSSSTKITKNQSVSRHAIRPGDTIVVTGVGGSGGTTTAATITDSGNRSGGSGSGSGSGSGGSGSGSGSGGNSAVGSLFSSGG